MKITLILSLLFLISCGQSKDYTKKNTDNPNFTADPDYIVMTAKKEYHPSKNTDGSYTVDENFIDVLLPATIKVTSGNAGNYYAILTMDSVTCYYKGGSNFSYPLQMNNQSEVIKGQEYKLYRCQDHLGQLPLKANDKILVSNQITLQIHNGDSTVSTEVRVSLEKL